MTRTQVQRLRELEGLEYDGVRLTDSEAEELRELLNAEEQAFQDAHTFDLPLVECDHASERSLETGRL